MTGGLLLFDLQIAVRGFLKLHSPPDAPSHREKEFLCPEPNLEPSEGHSTAAKAASPTIGYCDLRTVSLLQTTPFAESSPALSHPGITARHIAGLVDVVQIAMAHAVRRHVTDRRPVARRAVGQTETQTAPAQFKGTQRQDNIPLVFLYDECALKKQ